MEASSTVSVGSDADDALKHLEALRMLPSLTVTLLTEVRNPEYDKLVGAMLSEANQFRAHGFATDLHFVCRGGIVVPAHAVVVRQASPFLVDLTRRKDCPCWEKAHALDRQLKTPNRFKDVCLCHEKDDVAVSMSDYSGDIVNAVIEMMYVGQSTVESRNLEEFHEVAKMFNLTVEEVQGDAPEMMEEEIQVDMSLVLEESFETLDQHDAHDGATENPGSAMMPEIEMSDPLLDVQSRSSTISAVDEKPPASETLTREDARPEEGRKGQKRASRKTCSREEEPSTKAMKTTQFVCEEEKPPEESGKADSAAVPAASPKQDNDCAPKSTPSVANDMAQCPKCERSTSFSTRDALREHLILVHFSQDLDAYLGAGPKCLLCAGESVASDSGDSLLPSTFQLRPQSKALMRFHVGVAHGRLEQLLTERELFALYGFPRKNTDKTASLVLLREKVPASGIVVVQNTDQATSGHCTTGPSGSDSTDPGLSGSDPSGPGPASPANPKCPACGTDVSPARRPTHMALHLFNQLNRQFDFSRNCPHCGQVQRSKSELVIHLAVEHRKILDQFEKNREEMEEYIFNGGGC